MEVLDRSCSTKIRLQESVIVLGQYVEANSECQPHPSDIISSSEIQGPRYRVQDGCASGSTSLKVLRYGSPMQHKRHSRATISPLTDCS